MSSKESSKGESVEGYLECDISVTRMGVNGK